MHSRTANEVRSAKPQMVLCCGWEIWLAKKARAPDFQITGYITLALAHCAATPPPATLLPDAKSRCYHKVAIVPCRDQVGSQGTSILSILLCSWTDFYRLPNLEHKPIDTSVSCL